MNDDKKRRANGQSAASGSTRTERKQLRLKKLGARKLSDDALKHVAGGASTYRGPDQPY